MKNIKYILPVIGVLVLNIQAFAQDGKGPERFFNIKTYNADVTLTFKSQSSKSSDGGNTHTISVTQQFQHLFTTGQGQMAALDNFQVARGDKAKAPNETQENNIYGGVDMNAVEEAIKNSGGAIKMNSGMVPSEVMEMVKNSKKDAQTNNISRSAYN
jgi:hypothetical protein